jgi:hypothetical protein
VKCSEAVDFEGGQVPRYREENAKTKKSNAYDERMGGSMESSKVYSIVAEANDLMSKISRMERGREESISRRSDTPLEVAKEGNSYGAQR